MSSPGIGPTPGIEPKTSCSAVKHSTNQANPATVKENRQHFVMPPLVYLQNKVHNSIMMKCHYPDLGSAFECLTQISLGRPIRSKDVGSDTSSV